MRNDYRPLADRMRPDSIEAFFGQRHLLEPGKIISNIISSGRLPSVILWGPPGSGKTTLARILAEQSKAQLVTLSAVTSGVKDIREQVAKAKEMFRMLGQQTVLFIDEIHRFNKAQQDALLPHVESGDITLIGATTETPTFEINRALLSRCRVVTLEPLDDEAITAAIDRAITSPNGLAGHVELTDDGRRALLSVAQGDARAALTALEIAADSNHDKPIDAKAVEEAAQRHVRYDKVGEIHYNLASALIKSLRGSDPDASLYYAIRMLEGGEDPLFLLRRLVIFASEDIGNADTNALTVAVSATESFRFVGMPEGVLPITQAVAYLANAKKSNAVLKAYGLARKDVMNHPNEPVPKKLLNAPTKLHSAQGQGQGYKYPHNFAGNYIDGETYLPDALVGHQYWFEDE